MVFESVSLLQLYVGAFLIFFLAFVFGYAIARSGYKDLYQKELKAFKAALDKETNEKEKLQARLQRDISKAVTNEWNKGYDAAFSRLKDQFLYIRQWEKEHGMTPGELEALAQNFDISEKKEEEK